MRKAAILLALPKLSPEDRAEIMATLYRLEESGGPGAPEKALLDEAQAAFDANPTMGSPWSEVSERLRRRA